MKNLRKILNKLFDSKIKEPVNYSFQYESNFDKFIELIEENSKQFILEELKKALKSNLIEYKNYISLSKNFGCIFIEIDDFYFGVFIIIEENEDCWLLNCMIEETKIIPEHQIEKAINIAKFQQLKIIEYDT